MTEIVSSVAQALATWNVMSSTHPLIDVPWAGEWTMSGPEEGDTACVQVFVTDAAGEEIFEIEESGDEEADKQLGREIADALNAIAPVAPMTPDPVTRDFTFDVPLTATITVKAPDESTARRWLLDAVDCADTNFGAYPNGAPIVGEASIVKSAGLMLAMIDGEIPPAA